MEIVIEVPDRYVVGHDPAEVARQITLYAALRMFKWGKLSAGAAAQLAGIDRHSFVEECTKEGIPMANYPVSELAEEVAVLRVS